MKKKTTTLKNHGTELARIVNKDGGMVSVRSDLVLLSKSKGGKWTAGAGKQHTKESLFNYVRVAEARGRSVKKGREFVEFFKDIETDARGRAIVAGTRKRAAEVPVCRSGAPILFPAG